MSKGTHKTSVSTLLGTLVLDSSGTEVGRVQEFAVSPTIDAAHVSSLVLRARGRGSKSRPIVVETSTLRLSEAGELRMRSEGQPASLPESHDFLMLERDLLDQQIIDVHGHKVVRVNDVELVWEESNGGDGGDSVLRIHEVEIGLRGAVRRMLKGLPSASVQRIASRFRPNVIPWEFVDLIDRDPARRVRLKIEQDHISKMHPSDIADILEELAPAERQALFISLDEEIAAEALEEVKPKMQQALIEALDSERVAGIVEEMDPGAAADLLSELPEERSEAILEEMDPEERREVQDLLEFAGDSAAGRMTTEYVAIPKEASLSDAVTLLRDFDGDPELVTDLYLLDEHQHICGVVPLVQVLLAEPDAKLETLPRGHLVTCRQEMPGRKVAELFDKYNLRSLPVVDAENRIVGVVHAEQVIALLREKSS